MLDVTRGDRHGSRLVTRIDILEDQIAGHRVGLEHLVVTAVVGLNTIGHLIDRGVVTLTKGDGILRDTRLTRILLAVAIEVLEHVTMHGGEPELNVGGAQVQVLRVAIGIGGDGDIRGVENVIHGVIPVGDHVVTGLEVWHGVGAIGVYLGRCDLGITDIHGTHGHQAVLILERTTVLHLGAGRHISQHDAGLSRTTRTDVLAA